jgi:hypothetical protein
LSAIPASLIFLALALRAFAVPLLRLIALALLVLLMLLPLLALSRLATLVLVPILVLVPLIVSHGLSSKGVLALCRRS